MAKNPSANEHEFLLQIIKEMQQFDDEAKQRLIRTVVTYFNLGTQTASPRSISFQPERSTSISPAGLRQPVFSGHPEMSPKEFLQQKLPKTDIERVACLAYYLTHYLDTNHFKTIDINKLNMEAAQAKFSNASVAVNNAAKQGFLASAGKGLKQLSADGERYVDALPDRDASNAVRARFMKKRKRKRKTTPKQKPRV